MMRIGDFSKLSRVTVKTLRYYYEFGLLEPAQVDDFTGYRYYTYEQLPALETMACVVHHGPFVTIGEAYDALMKWIGENDYHIPLRGHRAHAGGLCALRRCNLYNAVLSIIGAGPEPSVDSKGGCMIHSPYKPRKEEFGCQQRRGGVGEKKKLASVVKK